MGACKPAPQAPRPVPCGGRGSLPASAAAGPLRRGACPPGNCSPCVCVGWVRWVRLLGGQATAPDGARGAGLPLPTGPAVPQHHSRRAWRCWINTRNRPRRAGLERCWWRRPPNGTRNPSCACCGSTWTRPSAASACSRWPRALASTRPTSRGPFPTPSGSRPTWTSAAWTGAAGRRDPGGENVPRPAALDPHAIVIPLSLPQVGVQKRLHRPPHPRAAFPQHLGHHSGPGTAQREGPAVPGREVGLGTVGRDPAAISGPATLHQHEPHQPPELHRGLWERG